jgi:hypothetical protein
LGSVPDSSLAPGGLPICFSELDRTATLPAFFGWIGRLCFQAKGRDGHFWNASRTTRAALELPKLVSSQFRSLISLRFVMAREEARTRERGVRVESEL